MKVFLPNSSTQRLGGGFKFLSNFAKCHPDIQIASTVEEADVILIASASMTKPDEYIGMKKPVVLRVDNILKNSRNRGGGLNRMESFARRADAVVYQSAWAEDFVGHWLKKFTTNSKSVIIRNGVDTSIFKPDGETIERNGANPVIIYSRFNRDETKGWHIAWDWYIHRQRQEPTAELWIVGQFSPELSDPQNGRFDFFDDERYRYWGVIESEEFYASILRSGDIFYAPYYNDACSNSILEARASGLQVKYLDSGGTPELMRTDFDISLQRMGEEYYSLLKSL